MSLPTKVTFVNQYKSIEWTYDAAGIKLEKKTIFGNNINTKDYIGGVEYANDKIEAVYHEEGRIVAKDSDVDLSDGTTTVGVINWQYEYSLSDHLGNSRVMFSDLDEDGLVDETEILQSQAYYPFGMVHEGTQSQQIGAQNKYQYNGKELNDDFGLGWTDYGARWYMADLGRWGAVDPAADLMPAWSPYSYTFNNPINYTDPTGAIPYPITIRSFAPFKSFGGGFHGDSRGFSNTRSYSDGRGPSARVHQLINFDTDKTTLKTNVWSSKTSHRFVPGSLTETPSVSIGEFSMSSGDGSRTFNFDTHSKGANPMAPGSPNIDVFSDFSITESDGLLSISGSLKGDNFPSTEAFISDPSGQNVFIGVGFYEGSPFSSLGGENQRDISSFNFGITTNSKGNFTGINYNGTNYSVSDWNNLFQQADPHKNADK